MQMRRLRRLRDASRGDLELLPTGHDEPDNVPMKTAEIKELSAAARNLAAARKSTGPTSPAGKLRSSLNAVRHGLAAANLLLPGENVEIYEARMDGVFTSLAPTDEAQAQLAALVGDDLWKLDRLARIEQGIVLGRVEELLEQTETSEQATTTAKALVALGTALRGWEAPQFPTKRDPEFVRRVGAMSDALEQVESLGVDLGPGLLQEASHVLNQLHYAPSEVPTAAIGQMFEAARKVMATLLDVGERNEALVQQLRAAIATIALPDETDSGSWRVTERCWRRDFSVASKLSNNSASCRRPHRRRRRAPRRPVSSA